LTDPLPPQLIQSFPFSVHITWDPVRFCGIDPPSILDSISYSIELAEGVEWKDGKLSQYMNDIMIPSRSYKPIFRSHDNNNIDSNNFELTIKELKPATWYHIRLVIDYLGLKVTSDALNIHTLRAPPSTPSIPRLSVFPVRSSYDLSSEIPSRLESLITWNSCYYTNGSPILSYQVHMRRLDHQGHVLNDDPPLLHKIKMDSQESNPQRSIAALLNNHQANNQWIQSPSKSEQQIRNSLKSRLQQSRGESTSEKQREQRQKSPQKVRKSLSTKAGVGQKSIFSSSSSLQDQPPPLQQPLPRHQSPSSGHHWRIVYDNLHRSLRMGAPRITDATWQIRVRARNSEGWSSFSPVLEVNHRTHPTLFVAANAAASASTAGMKSRQASRDASSPEDAGFNIDTTAVSDNNGLKGSAAGGSSYHMMNSPLTMQSFQSLQQQQQQQQQMLLQEMVMFPLAGHATDIERPVSRMPKQFGDLDAAADGAIGRRPLVLPELVHLQQGGSSGNQSQRGSSRGSSNHHR
jgi:hypothetical protein